MRKRASDGRAGSTSDTLQQRRMNLFMCGIVGIASTELGARQDIETIRLMCNAIVHRGPDDEGSSDPAGTLTDSLLGETQRRKGMS